MDALPTTFSRGMGLTDVIVSVAICPNVRFPICPAGMEIVAPDAEPISTERAPSGRVRLPVRSVVGGLDSADSGVGADRSSKHDLTAQSRADG